MTVNVAVSNTNNAVAKTTLPDATATITAATTGAPLSSYSFDFQGSTSTLDASTLNVDSVTVDGSPATFTRIENTTTSDATTDKHKLIVTPATPVSGTFKTVVKYSGTPVAHTDADDSSEGWNATTDGATFVNQPVGAMTAYPNNDTPSDKATYTMTINAPSKLTTSATAVSANPGLKEAAVVSNGELVSQTPNDDGSRTTWVWNEAKPMASELALISVGRYNTYHSDITLASGRTIPEWTFIDPAISLANQNTTLATRAQLKSILDFFETKYGPYPGNSVGIITDVVPSAINYALETQDRPFFPNSASRGTATHELMHQWFGDNESPADWNDIWLNEGPATYSETQLPFESSGASTTTTETSVFATYTKDTASNSLWTVPVAGMTDAADLFGSPTYTRGNMTLVALRTAIGDVAFAKLMNQWQVRYGGTSHHTSDFIALAEKFSGKDLTAFFNSWIYTTGKPAWPAKWNLSLTGPTAPVSSGNAVSYTLTSRNTGLVAQTGSVVTVDLTDVLDDATLGALPANVTVAGNTLTWTVPSTDVGASSTAVIPFTVDSGTSGDTLAAKAVTSSTVLGSTCFNCAASVEIGAPVTSPSAVPTIGGNPVFGQTLTADTAGWADGTKFSYQWLVNNTPVSGATGATFVPDAYSVGFPVSVQVTGVANTANPVTTTSDPTAAVTRAALVTSTPTISGTPQLSKTLTVDPGKYAAGTYFSYQWQVNGVNVTSANGGTGPSFTPTLTSQIGQPVSVAITPTKAGYVTPVTPNVPTSDATAAILGTPQTLTPTPMVSGTVAVNSKLTVTPGAWDDGTTLSYQWLANGAPIDGATDLSYTLAPETVGKAITVAVTSVKTNYATTTATSDPTAAVAPDALVVTSIPTIGGTARVGAVLSATAGSWDEGTTLAYQWFADGVAVPGAIADTYTPDSTELGKTVTVAVTGSKIGYAAVTTTSAATSAVAAGNLVKVSTPTISGTTKVGSKVTAAAGVWDAGTVFSYHWLRDGKAIAGATKATYTVAVGDYKHTVSVAVTGTLGGYSPITTLSVGKKASAGTQTHHPKSSITGTVKVGHTLKVKKATFDSGVKLSYAWYANGHKVAGTKSTHKLTKSVKGKTITVKVIAKKTGYTTVISTSAKTKKVK